MVQKIDYIWKGPWRTVEVIFILNRYGNLIGQSVFTLEEIGLLGSEKVLIPPHLYKFKVSDPYISFAMPFRGLWFFSRPLPKSPFTVRICSFCELHFPDI